MSMNLNALFSQYGLGQQQYGYSQSSKIDPRNAGLFRKPTGESGTSRTFNPMGEILAKGQHAGFKTGDVLALTAFFDKNKDGRLTEREISKAITALGKTDIDEDSAVGILLNKLKFKTDKTSDIDAFEQKRQIAGSIMQTFKDFFGAVDAMGEDDGAITTDDLIQLNKVDYQSRVLIDGESHEKASSLSDALITNADFWGALGLNAEKKDIRQATDKKNIPNFDTYKANADKANKGSKQTDLKQLIMQLFSMIFQSMMGGGGYAPQQPGYGGHAPQPYPQQGGYNFGAFGL